MTRRSSRTPGLVLTALAAGALAVPADPAAAQYFGRNKVQYESFDFRVLRSEHFDLHYYPAKAEAARDAARMSERWYARLAGVLGHEIRSRQPVILYADHADFQQTNVIGGIIDEATGGVTESLQRRVVMPLTPAYRETDHLLGHELVHAFQYDMAEKEAGAGIRRLSELPQWAVDGMAEYLSLGRADPFTALWLRDAVAYDDVPSIGKLSRDPRYFPYRFGHAVWAYIGGRFGDEKIGELYRVALREGWDRAVPRVLDLSADSLSDEWVAAVRGAYEPLLEGRTRPDSLGRAIAGGPAGPRELMLSPAASPDGGTVAFLWARDFSIDLFLADARTGEVRKRLASSAAASHFDAVSYTGSAGAWSPDGRKFAYVVFAGGDNELEILDVASGRAERRFAVPGVGAIATPAWSPDGRSIAFSGSGGGLSDLYLLDLEDGSVRRLTADRHADLQPAWSPDGRTLAFVTDRGSGTRFDRLAHGPMRIALLDVATGRTRTLPLLPAGDHISPQFSPDGAELYFVGAPDGFRDLYRVRLETGEVRQMTRLATGVTGLSWLSPALSVAQNTGEVFVSTFERRGYVIRALAPESLGAGIVAATTSPNSGAAHDPRPAKDRAANGAAPPAGLLPPIDARGAVDAYLADAGDGLPEPSSLRDREYSARPRLSYLGVPTLGIGLDRFGTGVYANAEAYFTDVLGDHGLTVQALANGGWKELGGQLFYESRAGRWNWGVGAGHIPLVDRFAGATNTTIEQNGRRTPALAVSEFRRRLTLDQAIVATRYPISATRRLELSGGALRISYALEVIRTVETQRGVVDRERFELDSPEPVTLWQAGAAYVGDNSVFGIASPIQGGRFRLELQPTLGTYDFLTALADWRRYAYRRPFTLAVRGLHYGRYGEDGDHAALGSLFVGGDALVRGYNYRSFGGEDCTAASSGPTGCAELDRLFGSRLAVANVELRLPLFGNDRFGLIDFAFLPTELAAFADAGVAWTGEDGPVLSSAQAGARTPVLSAGLSARVNLFGAFVLETYYAVPFQRSTGGRFGFQIAPGW